MLSRVLATAFTALLAAAQSSDPLEQAKRAFDAGRYAEAERLFETSRQRNSACDVAFYLGLARYRLHRLDAALIAFQEAAKCDPKLTLAYIAMAEAYSELGNDTEALAAWEHALALEPNNAVALRGAAALYAKGRWNAKAVAALETLVKNEPGDAQAHADLGAAEFGAGNQEEAAKEFEAALRLNPELPSALLGQANLLLRAGEETRAIGILRHLISLVPNAFEPRFVLGSAYNRLGRFAEATAELEAAVRLGGAEPEIYYHLARAYGGLGRAPERAAALAKFADLSRREKADTEARRQARKLVDQAKTMVASGDLPGALPLMEQARDLRPQDDSVLFRLASLDYDLARYDQGRDAIQEALALAPSEWVYHFLLGLIEGRSGRIPAARASLELAVRLNPSAAEAQNALGEVQQRQGDRRAAEASFRTATELDPGQAVYKMNLQNARKE